MPQCIRLYKIILVRYEYKVFMAWIWRRLKDIETHLKERDLVQKKHNKDVESYLSSLSQEAINQEWERKFKAEKESESP